MEPGFLPRGKEEKKLQIPHQIQKSSSTKRKKPVSKKSQNLILGQDPNFFSNQYLMQLYYDYNKPASLSKNLPPKQTQQKK